MNRASGQAHEAADQQSILSSHSSPQHTNSTDVVIAVDQIVPESPHAQSSPLLSPAHLRLPDSDEALVDPFSKIVLPPRPPSPSQPQLPVIHNHGSDASSTSPQESLDLADTARRCSDNSNSNSNSGSGGEPLARPLSPPHLPISPPFRGDPTSVFRYPGRSGEFTPSIRSERLPAHQHSTRPYAASIRNNQHEYPSPTMGDHRHLDGHPPPRDSGRPMTIDYAGLDASVTEAALIESGFLKTAFSDTTAPGSDVKEGRGMNRAASTGSSGRFGPSSPDSSGFRRRSARKASFYSERAPRPPVEESLRYTFYSRTSGLIQAPSMPQILSSATVQTPEGSEIPTVFSDLLKDGCFWIDILDPSDFDMQILAKHFHVHPLTIEDISTEEVREKYEVFRHYYFVCFRTFDQDYNSGSYLQPASMYCVVFKDGIMTFHFRPTTHHLNVLRRMEQLQLHISLTPDWINYALLDDITDSFASPIQTIEYEVDSIDELVLLLRENETTDMLRRIGSCRKNVMAMSRLLANKADVVRGLTKRFDDRYAVAPLPSSSATAAATTTAATAAALATHASYVNANAGANANASANGNANPLANKAGTEEYGTIFQHNHHRDGEILLYLGDILDHVLTMLQSLSSYEKILDRSHSNYLAQISLEINQLSNKMNEVVGTLTFFASLIVPMTFITGLWGMNIHVPGQPSVEPDVTLNWWWGLLGAMLLYTVVAILFGKRYGLI
ncbi:CorA metal ion transporter [Mortierella antarctica]|nr:CorA metal ion transporter [Mortierella antarctica]